MTLEADQAVQEARFAGACQDQHAGRPAPGLAKGNQSCNKPNTCFLIKFTGWPGSQGLGAQGLGARLQFFRRSEKIWWEAGEGVRDG